MNEEKVKRNEGKSPPTPTTQPILQNTSTEKDGTHLTSARLPHYVKLILIKDVRGRERSYRVPAFGLDLDRPKRVRTTFSNQQINVLEMEFASRQFLSIRRREYLATVLGLTETQVKVWFQNRRTKVRKCGDEKKVSVPPTFSKRRGEEEKGGDEEGSMTSRSCPCPSGPSTHQHPSRTIPINHNLHPFHYSFFN